MVTVCYSRILTNKLSCAFYIANNGVEKLKMTLCGLTPRRAKNSRSVRKVGFSGTSEVPNVINTSLVLMMKVETVSSSSVGGQQPELYGKEDFTWF